MRKKQEVITFKVEKALKEALDNVPNRSEFIRNAVLVALDSVCPICAGTGILTPNQKEHWREFIQNHELQKCGECEELHLVCGANAETTRQRGSHK